MCMGSDLTHDQNKVGMGVEGKRLIKGFVGRCSGKEQEQNDLTEIRKKAEEDAKASSGSLYSRAAAGLVVCCLYHEQRLMRRVEDAVSRVSASFNKHMRRLFEHN
ncbi:hypothetical protein M9H77_25805 [Catharanthus roseus]|uniref:Uncharacterized protein n=1 Tax=Catharanthus roseus TaxID=4058 RepID=A0ACC0A7X2_CATRO|nr:hypothetical protein M9H77_25805 [Catharanthus roseus]